MITCDTCGLDKEKVYFLLDNKMPNKRKSSCTKCFNKEKRKLGKQRKIKNKQDARRKIKEKKTNVILYQKNGATRNLKKIYQAENIPLFMQYNQLIYKHVENVHGLKPRELNLLLFTFPICPYTRKDFIDCREILNFTDKNINKRFENLGLTHVWLKGDNVGKAPTLYDFTDKGKQLIKDVYDWALGKKDIPEIYTDKSMDILSRIRRRNSSTP